MNYSYPQIFHLERPPFLLAYQTMPNTDLCTEGGNPSTGQQTPCNDCPEKMPFAPQDIFDVQYPEIITSVTVRLPNGNSVPHWNIVNFSGNRLRISFCNAPPCFTIEINNQCTLLAFERIPCYNDCATEPSPDPPNPLDPPQIIPQAAFIQFEHLRLSDNVAFSTNIVGLSDAQYSYTRYPNTPVTFLASSLNGAGGVVADHLHETTNGAIVSAQITQGLDSFAGWAFDVPSGMPLGYTQSGYYSPAPLPPTFVAGNMTSPNISFIVPAGTHMRARALFGQANNVVLPEYQLSEIAPPTFNFRLHNAGDVNLLTPIPAGYQLVGEIDFYRDSLFSSVGIFIQYQYIFDAWNIPTTYIKIKVKYFVLAGQQIFAYEIINGNTNTVLLQTKYFCIGQHIPYMPINFQLNHSGYYTSLNASLVPLPTAPQFGVNTDVIHIDNYGTWLFSAARVSNTLTGFTLTSIPISGHRLVVNYTMVVDASFMISNTISISTMSAMILDNYHLTIIGSTTLNLFIRYEVSHGNILVQLNLLQDAVPIVATMPTVVGSVFSGFGMDYNLSANIILNNYSGSSFFQSATAVSYLESI